MHPARQLLGPAQSEWLTSRLAKYATASVSSPGFEWALPLISSTLLTEAFPRLVNDLRYAETSKRGYLS